MHHRTPNGRAALAALLCVPTLGFALPTTSESGAAPKFRLEAQLSPDQRWLAVTGAHAADSDVRAWIVPLGGGDAREIESIVSNGSRTLGWDAQSHLRLQVVDRELGVPELRWIDVDSGDVVRSTRDREEMRGELRGAPASWATVEEKKAGERKLVRTVQWRDARRKIEISTQGESQFQVVAAPGIVFYSVRAANETQIFRCDVASGARREVLRSDAPVITWSASEDGFKLLLVEQGNEQRARVVDAQSGSLLHGPWMVAKAIWISGDEGRYLAATVGPRLVVIDVLRDRELDTPFESWPWMTALADGRFVVEDDTDVRLFDADFGLQRVLLSSPKSPETAAR
ncbi:MAG: hypothetical protein IT454_11750 [Planctomycetes bacterium]|nr:hypothetical protein [Planctomycetota bacterium]